MIDEKKIEEAVNQVYNSNAMFRRYEQAEIGFKAGINWFKENLWHDASEEPKPTPVDEYGSAKDEDVTLLLVVTKKDGVKIMYSSHETEYANDDKGYWVFHDYADDLCATYDPFFDEIEKWAYIDDLLKGGE